MALPLHQKKILFHFLFRFRFLYFYFIWVTLEVTFFFFSHLFGLLGARLSIIILTFSVISYIRKVLLTLFALLGVHVFALLLSSCTFFSLFSHLAGSLLCFA